MPCIKDPGDNRKKGDAQQKPASAVHPCCYNYWDSEQTRILFHWRKHNKKRLANKSAQNDDAKAQGRW